MTLIILLSFIIASCELFYPPAFYQSMVNAGKNTNGGGGGGGGADNRGKFEQERVEKQELNALFSDVYSQLDKPGNPGAARAAAQRGTPQPRRARAITLELRSPDR